MKSIKLISLGLLLVLLTSTATALPVGGLGHTGDNCTYAGKTYSEGSRVKQNGKNMECHNGKWVERTGIIRRHNARQPLRNHAPAIRSR